MDEKKSFFASLEPKSALLVGIVTGVLTLCTIGFVIMLAMFLSGRAQTKADNGQLAAANGLSAEEGQKSPPKSDRPKVELFVMSYCPYGLQMEKAFLPVWELLQDKAGMDVKFASYAMHGLKEIEENTRQFCIQSELKEKYISYLKCFTGKDDYKACLRASGISEAGLAGCVNVTNKKFGVMEKYNDQKTWLSGRFPLYPVQADLNDKYRVEGSPTLVVNGEVIGGEECQSSAACHVGAACVMTRIGKRCIISRTAMAVKQVVCAAFNNPPAECEQTLSATPPSDGFGTGTGDAGADTAACGS